MRVGLKQEMTMPSRVKNVPRDLELRAWCSNPDCRMKYYLPKNEAHNLHCPKCGWSMKTRENHIV